MLSPHRLIHAALSLKASVIITELAGTIAMASFAIAPDLGDNELMWIWRSIIAASILLNLHFLRKVYFKVGRVDVHSSQISIIVVALEYLATEAAEHGGGRSTDKLLITLLENVKKLQPPPEDRQ